ncbi:MAG TPA: MFS transporter [Candidatus Angelobacter sp.]|nr:MFS transporter [Candidatus Angelobacter sp.]
MTETISVKPSFRRVLSNRPFSLLWAGQLVSQSGDFIFDVAAIWYVLQLTGDPFKVGIAVATILLPAIFIGPIAGVYLDRFNRRDVMLSSNIVQAAIAGMIGILYSLGSLSFLVLLVMLFVLNSGAQFVRPAVQAIVPGITEKEDLSTANSLFSLSTSVNQVAGYGIGGIIVLALGVAVPFYYDSLTFLFAAAMLSLISRSLGAIPRNVAESTLTASSVSFREKFVQGLRFIHGSRFLIQLVIVGLVVNFFGAGVFALLAPYAKNVIGGNAGTYGAILTTYSIGAAIGSVLVGKLQLRNYVGRILFAGVIAQGFVIIGVGFTTLLFLALALSFVIGVLQTMVNVPMTVLVQVKVPGDMLGRVFTSLVALLTIVSPISSALAGGLATSISIGGTFEVFGGMIVVACAVGFLFFRDLRDASY